MFAGSWTGIIDPVVKFLGKLTATKDSSPFVTQMVGWDAQSGAESMHPPRRQKPQTFGQSWAMMALQLASWHIREVTWLHWILGSEMVF